MKSLITRTLVDSEFLLRHERDSVSTVHVMYTRGCCASNKAAEGGVTTRNGTGTQGGHERTAPRDLPHMEGKGACVNKRGMTSTNHIDEATPSIAQRASASCEVTEERLPHKAAISRLHARCVSDTRTHQDGRLLSETAAARSDFSSLLNSRPTSDPNAAYAKYRK